jgi:hypothetical protein
MLAFFVSGAACNKAAEQAVAYLRARGLVVVTCVDARKSEGLTECQADGQHFRCVTDNEGGCNDSGHVACELETFGAAPPAERTSP